MALLKNLGINRPTTPTFRKSTTPTTTMITYNSRYPGFDEEDYRKLEQGAINRGLTGQAMTDFMDEAYQFYYPQVLNSHKLDERQVEINKSTAENGNAILNGDKQAQYNMKLVDLAQTAKRIKGIAYDYPDQQVIDLMKNNIPDGEQLLLNYLNNGDDTILYRAGLKRTDAQVQLDKYNATRDNIQNVLTKNWEELSTDGLKYLRDYNVLFQVVDEARKQGMGQGMTDNDLLLNLSYMSPEIQQIADELGTLNLDKEDMAIFGMLDKDSLRQDWNTTKNNFRDFIGWNSDTPATLSDIEQAIYVAENKGGQTWANMKTQAGNRGDSQEKFWTRLGKDIQNAYYNFQSKVGDIVPKSVMEKLLGYKLSDEEYNQALQYAQNNLADKVSANKQFIQEFNASVDRDTESRARRNGLDPIVADYYNKQGYIESLANEGGFGYKSLGDAAGNWDMVLGMLGSVVNPALGMAIMGTDTFSRENQEAFDTLMNAQTKQGVSYEDAYDNAQKGAFTVGAINTAIELGLEKWLGGVETRTAGNIKDFIGRNLNKEVSDMVAKRGIVQMLTDGLTEQAKASLEEGLEEIFQQLTSNIAESGYDPDKKISEGLWRAFESGALNPMNLLAGGSELLSTPTTSDIDRDTFVKWANSLDIGKSQRNGTYNPQSIVNNIKNGVNNQNTKAPFWTRTLPEAMVKSEIGLTPGELETIERISGYSAPNLLLKWNLAQYDDTGRAIGVQEKMDNNYKTITKEFKKIKDGTKISNENAKHLVKEMIDGIEGNTTLMEAYGDTYLPKLKQLYEQSEITPLEGLFIGRDFNILEGDNIYNSKGQVKSGFEKTTIDSWRNGLIDQLNEIGKQNGIDLRELNAEISAGITMEKGLLKKIAADGKNGPFSLKDLGWGHVLTSGDPFKSALVIGGKKLVQKKSGKRAQELYNKNNQPLNKKDRGGNLSTKKSNDFNGLSIASLPTDTANASQEQIIPDAGDLGNLPLNAIQDKNVGANPTSTVVSENVNKNGLNQASEQYNQGDKNLSPNSEQMETTKKTTKKKSTKKGKKGDVKWYADEAYSPEIVMTEEEINKWEEKNGTNDTDKISLKRDLIDKLMKKGNYGEKVKVIIRKNGEMAGTHTIEKFQGDGKTYYNIDLGTPDWKVFDVKDMKNWLINNDTVYAEMGGEKYTTPEYSKWEEERNAQIEKEREESGIAEQERKISNNLLSKIGDKGTIERFKDYFKGELAKNGGKYDMYKDILAFLEGKKTVDDFVEGEIVINDFPNSVMKEIRENLGLNAISIKNLHSMIKEYGKNKNKAGNKTKQYADNSYKPSITMKIDMNKEIIKTIKDMNMWDKLGFVDKFNRKGVLERTNEGYEYHFLNDAEEGSSPFPTVLSDMDIIGFTEPYYGAADPDYSDILSPKETKQESKPKKEKPLTKKQTKEEVNNLISDTWSDIGDEGDWDWYKKMKKKDVITYLEDQVSGEFSDARKRGYDYGLEWSEVQKMIKKFVNQKMK